MVADAKRRREHRATDPDRVGRPGLERRYGPPCQWFHQPPANGAWHTTTANLWGGLALEKFSAKFEAVPVAGTTKASMSTGSASVDWSKVERIKTTDASGAAHQTTWFGAPAAPGNLRNNSMFLPWSKTPGKDGLKDTLTVTHQGTGKPWLTLQSIAAIQLKEPFNAGYQIKKTVTPVEQANKGLPAGSYTRGDVLRVSIEVNASADMTWAVITDPVPGGATILGSGLGRDSEIATQGEKKKAMAGRRLRNAASNPSAATTSTRPKAWSRWNTPFG